MNEDDRQVEDQRKQRRTRRLSIFLILGIVAVAAIGTWVFSSWFSDRYGNPKKLENLPPPPSRGGQPQGGASPQ